MREKVEKIGDLGRMKLTDDAAVDFESRRAKDLNNPL